MVSVLLACAAVLNSGSSAAVVPSPGQPARITFDYPLEGSIFPPEITPPNFLWHDPTDSAKRWLVEVSFAGRTEKIRLEIAGEHQQKGKIDPEAGPDIELTPEQMAARTWRPDAETWTKIKGLSVKSAAAITISGFAGGDDKTPVSAGKVTISTSADPVDGLLFYRDVPLKTSTAENGPIAPLPLSAIPLIKWQVRSIAETESHTVMGNVHTCANCHSFSRDGRTMGLDVDGPRNDKGLYALVPVGNEMTIGNKDVIRWSSFQVEPEARSDAPAVKRFGFMSQVSPDGRYVVTSIAPPKLAHSTENAVPGFAPGLSDRLYNTNYPDIAFNQVFYPTRGILAWYDKQEQKMRPLPGADDPQFVQTSAFWSPDGKYLIFSRATARDPYPPRASKAQHANDPNETQIQYDLYKIPFNGGKGGKAVPVVGASQNGMSNNFPKVSPDGRWIVFVENKNGLLMRPDSRLFIVPFEGGKARLMNCNLSLMNSWHTFSPNGRWLAFSSKGRSIYTQLLLTHIDAKGNDSPAILVENTTAANRAVNIPEFVNVPPGGMEKIDPQAMEFYRLVDDAYRLVQSNRVPEAIQTLRSALERDPDDAMAHYNLATLLAGVNRQSEALEEYRKASDLSPEDTLFLEHLAVELILNGDAEGGIERLKKAITLQPGSPEFRFNLGYVLESRGDFAGALEPLQKAVELSEHQNGRFLAELANASFRTGHSAEAIQNAREALDLAQRSHDEQLAQKMRDALSGYESEPAKAKPE
ncbi:MAG: tetratricopeptide repeat protein [Terracidiphilus sp.]